MNKCNDPTFLPSYIHGNGPPLESSLLFHILENETERNRYSKSGAQYDDRFMTSHSRIWGVLTAIHLLRQRKAASHMRRNHLIYRTTYHLFVFRKGRITRQLVPYLFIYSVVLSPYCKPLIQFQQRTTRCVKYNIKMK